MLNWRKLGLVFEPTGRKEWMHSHAQCPFPVVLEDRVRVYFSTREQYNNGLSRAHGGYVDLDRADLTRVVAVSDSPLISLGGLGEFDEFGSMPGSVIWFNGKFLLFYCGWSRGSSTPYSWAIGVGESSDGSRFTRGGRGPLIGPILNEPFLQACPVVYEFEPGQLEMFYLSGTNWLTGGSKPESQYVLMRATSTDGYNWNRNSKPLLNAAVEHESQTSAAIFKRGDRYHMYFSYRYGLDFRENAARGYRIGYAWSKDRVEWHRSDEVAGIDCSENGWDSQMVAYPHVIDLDGKLVMFYCGNEFGKFGFGVAVAEPS